MKYNLTILGLLFCFAKMLGQLDTYDRKIPLGGIAENWHRIKLPETVFNSVKDDFSDIRIYGITEKDTIEVPYVITSSIASGAETQMNFKLINSTSTTGGFYYTYEVPTNESINQIDLNFKNLNFDWKLNLEGSQNQTEWFTILEDYRILSIRNGQTDYSFTKLHFTDSKFRYFRLFIKTKETPELLQTYLVSNESIPATYTDYPVGEMHLSESNKQTFIDIDLKKRIPVSLLKLHVSDTFEYYRPTFIQYVSDSVKTEKGWKYSYQNLASGTLTSLEKNEFRFKSTLLQKLRVAITNYDNEPLKIENVDAKGYTYHLTARFTQPANYVLAYGKKEAYPPRYDLLDTGAKLPENLTFVTLGTEILIPKKENPMVAPLFENKIWLWIIMGSIILVLGGFTLKMIQQKS